MNTNLSSVDKLEVGLNDFTWKHGSAGADAEICDGIDRLCARVVRVVDVLSGITGYRADQIPVGGSVFVDDISAFGVITASNFGLRIGAEFYALMNLPHFSLASRAYAQRQRMVLFASASCTSF